MFFFLCFTTGLVSANQNQLFFEDFSEDLSQWQIAGSPTPAIVNSEGNPAPSFCTNDDLNYGGWAVSNNSFDYSNGLSISLDLKPGNASFPDQRKVCIVSGHPSFPGLHFFYKNEGCAVRF